MMTTHYVLIPVLLRMAAYSEALSPAYIDPNTSQHVFSLLGPMLAFLAGVGGFTLAAIVFVRHRIASYLRKASWPRRMIALSCIMGVLALMAAVLWWILR